MSEKCTKAMKCRIGQLDRCIYQKYCSWEKVFGDTEPEKLTPIQYTAPGNRRRKLYDLADGICYLCEKKIKYFSEASIDHVIPLSKGGTSKKANLKIAHKSCNGKKGNTLLEDLVLPFR